jgi:DHA2 family multidrug resistance protein-like MFS transporter
MTVSEKSRWLILIVLSSALFLIVIDMTVLYTALPSLARDLGTSASEKLWIIKCAGGGGPLARPRHARRSRRP